MAAAAAAADDDDDDDDDDADAVDEETVAAAMQEPDSEWSLVDDLLQPWMIAVYVIVGLIACIFSIFLLRRAIR